MKRGSLQGAPPIDLPLISSFASTSYYLIVFLLCLHVYLLSHFRSIRCIVKSLIATLTLFLLKYNWKKKISKVSLGHQDLGGQTSIPVFQMAWICHWMYLNNWWFSLCPFKSSLYISTRYFLLSFLSYLILP